MIGILVAAIITDPHTNGFESSIRAITSTIFFTVLYVTFGSFCALFVGFFSSLVLAIFDHSIGKLLTPTLIAAAVSGMSVIPISIMGIFLHAFSTYPESELFVFLFYVPTIIVGCVCGIWGANARIVVDSKTATGKWQLNIRQLFVVTAWVGLILALGFGDLVLVIASIIYIATVVLVVIVYTQIIRPIRLHRNGE